MKIHLIAIGGSVMHNLALNLAEMGHTVSGSDDEIYEPSKSRLSKKGLLPKMGWNVDNISDDIDCIILGKHAKSDNPELKRAITLGLKIMSFPEFVNASSKATKKVAITGSHGKTSTTAMILHVLRLEEMDFDYLVGAQLKGFETMVRLSGADILVVEGDEYPSSCLDNRAKMLHYGANISVVTGIAWDHVNIYKTESDYIQIFDDYLNNSKANDIIFFDETDDKLLSLVINGQYKSTRVGYSELTINKKGAVLFKDQVFPIKIFGNHNLKNLHAAMKVCEQLGVEAKVFLKHIESFTGAAKRLELIKDSESQVVYKDFAHAPSKAKATSEAVRGHHPNKKIFGILELHTFSSLTGHFIDQYADTLHSLDEVRVFYDPHAIALKNMPPLDRNRVANAFNHHNLEVIDKVEDLKKYLIHLKELVPEVLLIMSSGNLGGLPIEDYLE